MNTLWQDIHYGARMLLKKPGFTLIAMITLALGIGANTAIFSVLNAVVLKPLPFEHAEQLVMAWESNPEKSGFERMPVAPPNYLDWRHQNHVFEEMVALRDQSYTLTGAGDPEQILGDTTTAGLFPLLRVEAALGRTFNADDEKPGQEQVVVISHGLWQRRFGSDAGLIGKTIKLNGKLYTVVGVMPENFHFPTPEAELWTPLIFKAQDLASRGHKNYLVIGRLKDGVSLQQAQTEIGAITERIKQTDPEKNAGFGASLQSLRETFAEDFTQLVLVLLIAVGFVLLIACANISNLLLARASARQKEMAIRLSLGATRWRIVRQLMTESVLLAVAGGLVGLLLAAWGKDWIVMLAPNELFRVKDLGLDTQVLGFTLAISLLTGFVFGFLPALHASQQNLSEALKESGASATGSRQRHRARGLLVVSEVALAMILLVGAGLMMKSLLMLRRSNPGFNPRNLLSMTISLPEAKYSDKTKQSAFFQRLLSEVSTLPGVQSAGVTNELPISSSDSITDFIIEGRPAKTSKTDFDAASRRAVNPDYFKTLGIRLLRGRAFTEHDTAQSPRVAIINETLVKRYFGSEDPIGKRLSFDEENGKRTWCEIVGIVSDVKHLGLREPTPSEMLVPYLQRPEETMSLAVRTAEGIEPLSLTSAVRHAVQSVDRDQPVYSVETMEQRLANLRASERLIALLIGLFATLATLLSAVGIYGVISYSVAQRTREIGIRLALGAQHRDVLKLVLRQGLETALVGVGVGLLGALTLMQLMKDLLFGVSATDPLTFAAIAALLTGVALLACYIPARRATKVDPMVALRYE